VEYIFWGGGIALPGKWLWISRAVSGRIVSGRIVHFCCGSFTAHGSLKDDLQKSVIYHPTASRQEPIPGSFRGMRLIQKMREK
jgi:hypothetical protein